MQCENGTTALMRFDLVDKMLFFDWKLTLADNDLKKVNTMCDLAGVDVALPDVGLGTC